MKIILGIGLILGYYSFIDSWTSVFICFMLVESLEFSLNMYFYFKFKSNQTNLQCFKFKMIEKICFSLIWIALAIYQAQIILNDYLYLFSLPLIAFAIFIYF